MTIKMSIKLIEELCKAYPRLRELDLKQVKIERLNMLEETKKEIVILLDYLRITHKYIKEEDDEKITEYSENLDFLWNSLDHKTQELVDEFVKEIFGDKI